MEDYKLIVAGSREITDQELIRKHMNEWWMEHGPFTVVSGMARGVDTVAAQLANKAGTPLIAMPAKWDTYGRSAGYRRNEEMAKIADGALIFWDGKSKGTKHMIDLTYKYDIYAVIIVILDEDDIT